MSRLEASSDEIMGQLVDVLRRHKLIATEETGDQSTIFVTNANQIFTPNTASILFITVTEQANTYNLASSRRFLQNNNTNTSNTTGNATSNATTNASNTSNNDNQIYIKPDALFGLVLSLFIFFIAYVGVMCLYGVNTPKGFASKPFKFGKEM